MFSNSPFLFSVVQCNRLSSQWLAASIAFCFYYQPVMYAFHAMLLLAMIRNVLWMLDCLGKKIHTKQWTNLLLRTLSVCCFCHVQCQFSGRKEDWHMTRYTRCKCRSRGCSFSALIYDFLWICLQFLLNVRMLKNLEGCNDIVMHVSKCI